MKKIEIWTFKTCPYCIKAKKLLNLLDIDYIEHMIPYGDNRLNTLEKQSGCDTLPQLFVDGVFIGDCSKMYALHKKDLLLNLLK